MPNIQRLLAAILAFPVLVGTANAADAVLLSSTAPGYTTGMVVLETDRLSVPDGASLTLLFQSGEVLRIGGPFTGTIQPPTSGADTSVSRLADLFRAQGTDASVIGGSRSADMRAFRAELDDVLVEPGRSGTYCVGASTSVWIARPGQDLSSASLRRRGSVRALAWPDNADRIEWPFDVPIDDASQFTIEAGGKVQATITFHRLDSEQANGTALLVRGSVLGCREQFENELRKVSLSVVQPELWITTDHGRRPKYRKGEPVALTVTASVDGFLYCVGTGDDASTTAIFPAGSIDGAQVHASTALVLPGRRQPNALQAGPGLNRIRCWLADRNLSAELPNGLVGTRAGKLPESVAADLDGLFQRIGGPRLEASTLAIEIE